MCDDRKQNSSSGRNGLALDRRQVEGAAERLLDHVVTVEHPVHFDKLAVAEKRENCDVRTLMTFPVARTIAVNRINAAACSPSTSNVLTS